LRGVDWCAADEQYADHRPEEGDQSGGLVESISGSRSSELRRSSGRIASLAVAPARVSPRSVALVGDVVAEAVERDCCGGHCLADCHAAEGSSTSLQAPSD
jgi:hypothetical protein